MSPLTRLLVATSAVAVGGIAPSPWLPPGAARVRDVLRDDGRNAADLLRMERGYYERLLDEPSRLTTTSDPHPAEDFGPLTEAVADAREYVLRSNLHTTLRGRTWTTNADGQRDQPFRFDRAPGSFRVVMAGDSIGSGWGVDDGAGFEPTWERSLRGRVEVCNLAVPGHAPGQRWDHVQRSGWRLQPDLVIFQGTAADLAWDERKLRSLLPRGLGWDAPGYRQVLETSLLSTRTPTAEEARRVLRPRREALLQAVYQAVVDDCRRHEISAVWLLLPRVGKPVSPAERTQLTRLASSAGFAAVIDLSDTFDGLDPTTLAISPTDFHPNEQGHRRIALRLAEAWSALRLPPLAPSDPGDSPR